MRRIVLVTPFAPVRDGRHGSARAVRGIVMALAGRHEVVVLHLGDDADLDPELTAACIAVHALAVRAAGPWSRRLRGAAALARGRTLWTAELDVDRVRRCVRRLAADCRADVVQVEQGVLGEALAGATPGQLKVVTIYDPAALRRESIPLRREGLPLAHRIDARAALRQERRVLARADAAVVFTERDRRLLARTGGRAEIVTIPLGWDVPAAALDPGGAQPPTLLLVGNFTHAPNVEAAVTLATRILPLVRATHPEARAEIVGGSPPRQVLALAGEAVRVSGDVASVTPYLERAAIVVAPIATGGGMRVKLLEALAAGKATVASSRAAEGLGAIAGEELVVADGDPAMAAAICALLDDDDARRRMAARARAWAQRELSWSVVAARYEELYARLDKVRNRG